MLEDLFDSVYETVEANKLEVWWKSMLKVNVNGFFLFLDVTSIISVRDSKIINIFLNNSLSFVLVGIWDML